MRGKVFVMSVVLEVAALWASVIAVAGGHGTYLPAQVLFPYSLLLAYPFQQIGAVSVALAIIQFPAYGLLIAEFPKVSRFFLVLVMLAHLIAATLAVGLAPDFVSG